MTTEKTSDTVRDEDHERELIEETRGEMVLDDEMSDQVADEDGEALA